MARADDMDEVYDWNNAPAAPTPEPIVARLRNWPRGLTDGHSALRLMTDAADLIERLVCERDEVDMERRGWKDAYDVAIQERNAAEARIAELEPDAARWREHEQVMRMAALEGALRIRLTMMQDGNVSEIEAVLSTIKLGHGTLGTKAVGLAAEQQAGKLFAAIYRAKGEG